MKKILILLPIIFNSTINSIQTNLSFSPQLIREIIGLKKDPTNFSQHYQILVNQLSYLNGQIPLHAPSKKSIRVMSYNVHRFSNAQRISTEDQIVKLLQKTNPDILILQEAENNHPILQRLKKIGFIFNSFAGIDSKINFGNMVLSKLPFKHVSSHEFSSNNRIKMGRTRSFIKAEFDLSPFKKNNLVIYATHLAIYTQVSGYNPKNIQPDQEIRLLQVQELMHMIKQKDAQKNVIIAGDFNDTNKSTASQFLLNNGFNDCFSRFSQDHLFTSLYGQRIDFIKTRLKDISLAGCYFYFSAASDHLPIIVDIQI